MTTLNADETLLAYLCPLKEETQIRDTTGKIIGRYTPGTQTDELTEEEVRRLFDLDAIKRRKPHEIGKGLTTQEVLTRLHGLKEGGQ